MIRALLFLVATALLFGCSAGAVGPENDLSAPRLLTPAENARTADAILLTWSTEDSAQRYRVQVAEDAEFSRLLIDEVSGTRPYRALRDLPMDADLFWRVRSETDTAASEWSGVRHIEIVSHARPPQSPRLTLPDDGTLDLERTVLLEWDPVPDAYAYHLVVTIDEDMFLYQADLENLKDPFFELNGLIFTYPYWWKVRALGPAGYSEWSPVWIFQVRDGE